MGVPESRQVAFLVLHSALSPRISLRNRINPSTSPLGNHLTWALPDHVHYLAFLDRPPGAVKGSEPLAGVDPSFDRSMILFHDVVQVKTGTTATPTSEFALLL